MYRGFINSYQPSCFRCGKKVYSLEKLRALNKIFHKICFRCVICDNLLTLKTYREFDRFPYCQSHSPSKTQAALNLGIPPSGVTNFRPNFDQNEECESQAVTHPNLTATSSLPLDSEQRWRKYVAALSAMRPPRPPLDSVTPQQRWHRYVAALSAVRPARLPLNSVTPQQRWRKYVSALSAVRPDHYHVQPEAARREAEIYGQTISSQRPQNDNYETLTIRNNGNPLSYNTRPPTRAIVSGYDERPIKPFLVGKEYTSSNAYHPEIPIPRYRKRSPSPQRQSNQVSSTPYITRQIRLSESSDTQNITRPAFQNPTFSENEIVTKLKSNHRKGSLSSRRNNSIRQGKDTTDNSETLAKFERNLVNLKLNPKKYFRLKENYPQKIQANEKREIKPVSEVPLSNQFNEKSNDAGKIKKKMGLKHKLAQKGFVMAAGAIGGPGGIAVARKINKHYNKKKFE